MPISIFGYFYRHSFHFPIQPALQPHPGIRRQQDPVLFPPHGRHPQHRIGFVLHPHTTLGRGRSRHRHGLLASRLCLALPVLYVQEIRHPENGKGRNRLRQTLHKGTVGHGRTDGTAILYYRHRKHHAPKRKQRLGYVVRGRLYRRHAHQNVLHVSVGKHGDCHGHILRTELRGGKNGTYQHGAARQLFMVCLYCIFCFIVLHIFARHIIYLFVDFHEYEIIEKANQFIVTSCTYFIPLGLLCLLRYSIQGLGYSKLAMMSGVFEMVDRTAVSLFLVPILGYTGVCYGDPSAWFAADLFLIPAYLYVHKRLSRKRCYAQAS